MKNAITLTLLAVTVAVSLGCSTRWREGSSDRNAADVKQLLTEAASAQSGSGDVSAATQYQEGAYIYFAEAPSDGIGQRAANLLAFNDLSWLGSVAASADTIANARVFFLDNGSGYGLVVGTEQTPGSGYTYSSFGGTGRFEDGEFVADLTGSGGSIRVRSWDVSGSDLQSVIQLRVYHAGDGGEDYLGKITVLFGVQ